jgi:hypothetical protein
MKFYQFKIDRKRLDDALENERTLFLILGHFANQSAILGKCVAWCAPNEVGFELERKGRIAQSMLVLTLLAAKLNEGWELLHKQYFASGVSKEYAAKLAKDAREALDGLGRYFGKDNALHTCRNEYAMHYDPEALKASYGTLPADEETDFFLCEFPGCNLFHVAEMAAGHALLEKLGKGDRRAGMELLVEETMKVSMWFQTFIAGFAHVFLERIGTPDGEPQEVSGLPAFDSVSVPFVSEGPV